MTATLNCDVCLDRDRPGRPVLRLNVTRTTHPEGGKTQTRGAGSILMCKVCWERICKPRMRVVAAKNRRKIDRIVATA